MRSHIISATALVLSLFTFQANASLSTDLQGLVSDLNIINSQLATASFTSDSSCTELGSVNTSIADYLASVDQVYKQLAAPLTLTEADFTSLNDLSALSKDAAGQALRLSIELASFKNSYDLFEYRAALSAMLRLSDDIGTMADRILEMADRILVMADNIGLMADRILITQQLQNNNVALTQAAILSTQQNLVSLSDSLSTIAYNVTLGQLNIDTQALSDQMAGTTLAQDTMATQLLELESTTSSILTRTVALYTLVMQNSQSVSHYIDGDTLTMLGDLSSVHNALAVSLEAYANAIDSLASQTDIAILNDATASMLRLTQDIGVMSDRIMEMTAKIIVMADNIGIMSQRIIETQNIQQTNIVLTQNSMLTAQSVTLTVIRNFGL